MIFNPRIWLIGGTSESAKLAAIIAESQINCIITVTTESAKSLYPESEFLTLWVGKLQPNQVGEFISHYKINKILDASHPYAVEISQLAIAISQTYFIPYLRYERPTSIHQNSENIIYLASLETLLSGNYLAEKRVLLTLGYRMLSSFTNWQEKAQLFTRILPSPTALEAALKAGFTSDRIIAIRPPLSLELEKALWQQWNIDLVVTKASGVEGGEEIKIAIAHQLNLPLIIIERPPIHYPQMTRCFQTVLEFLNPEIKDKNDLDSFIPHSIT